MINIADRGLRDLADEKCLRLMIAALAKDVDGANDFLIEKCVAVVARNLDGRCDGRDGGGTPEPFGGELSVELVELYGGVGVIA